MLGWAWEQLATLEAETEQTVVRGKGLGSRSQRKRLVWNPDTLTLITELGGPRNTCFFLLRQSAEVSISQLLVILFFN